MSRTTKIWLVFAGIIVFASFLRLYHITRTPPGLYPDEAMDGNNALEVVQTGHFQVFYIEDNGREGLYVNTLVFFIKVFGNKPWVVRFPAAIAGILTVAGMYFLGAELFGVEIGLLAAFLLGTCFWHINFSRIGFRAIMAPLALCGRSISLSNPSGHRKKRALDLCHPWAASFSRAGFYTYIAYRVTPLLLLLFIPFFKKYPDFWKRTAIFVAVTFLVALPIGLYFLHNPGDFFGRTGPDLGDQRKKSACRIRRERRKNPCDVQLQGRRQLAAKHRGRARTLFPGRHPFPSRHRARGHQFMAKHKKKVTRLHANIPLFGILVMFGWFILAMLPAAASDEGIPHALRSILMLPPAIFFAAIAGVWAYRDSGITDSRKPR